MKFFLVQHFSLHVVEAENEHDAFEHFNCNKRGHSVEWKSSCCLMDGPVEVPETDHWPGWWTAREIFEQRLRAFNERADKDQK